MPLADASPVPGADGAAATGSLSRNAMVMNGFLTFRSAFEGPPAVVTWLQARGCSDFRYELTGGGVLDDEHLED